MFELNFLQIEKKEVARIRKGNVGDKGRGKPNGQTTKPNGNYKNNFQYLLSYFEELRK